MAKRKSKSTGLGGLTFDKVDPYGRAAQKDSLLQVQYVPLDGIRPDPDQPRQVLPIQVAQQLANGEITQASALSTWLSDESAGSKRQITELRKRATSIENNGLINPITLRSAESNSPHKYYIITGERRYWAHVLLHLENRSIKEGSATHSAESIKALISGADITIRAHQMIENLMREDMNAIEKAHGLWALRSEMSGVTYRTPVTSSDGEVTYRTPTVADTKSLVTWQEVADLLGISKRHRIRMTAVLNLCAEAQKIVAEHALAEMTIRPIVDKLKDQPELQVKVLNQLLIWQQHGEQRPEESLVASVQSLVESLLAQSGSTSAPAKRAKRNVASVTQFQRKVQTAAQFLGALNAKQRDKLASDLAKSDNSAEYADTLRDLRTNIDGILAKIDANQN